VSFTRDGDHGRSQVEVDRAGDGTGSQADREAGTESWTAPIIDQHIFASIGPAANAPQQMPVHIRNIDDLLAAGPLVDHEVFIAPTRDLGVRGEHLEPHIVVIADDHTTVFVHDGAVAGLLDDNPAAGFNHAIALRAHLLDIDRVGDVDLRLALLA